MQGAIYEEIAEAASQQEFATCSDSEEMLLFRPALFSEGPYNVVLAYAQTMAPSQHKPKDQQHLQWVRLRLIYADSTVCVCSMQVVLHIQSWHAKCCGSLSAWLFSRLVVLLLFSLDDGSPWCAGMSSCECQSWSSEWRSRLQPGYSSKAYVA